MGVNLGAELSKHNIIKEDMHFTTLKDKSYDLGILRHALEHSVMPYIMLLELKRIVRKYVIIVNPIYCKRMFEWQNHFSVLPKRMLVNLFEKAGFDVLRYKKSSYYLNEFGDWDKEHRFLLKIKGN